MTMANKFKIFLKFLLPGVGGFIAIWVTSMLGNISDVAFLMAPFGASCVLVFLLPSSPLAQPKNVILGHLLSTFIGLVILQTVGNSSWSIALGVGLAIILMNVCKVVHPPAGGDPILVIMTGSSWTFLVTPVLVGTIVVVAIGYAYHKLNRVPYPLWANR